MIRQINVDGLSVSEDSPDVVIGAVRNDRTPRDLSVEVTNSLNKFFISKVGLPLRSASLFTVQSTSSAEEYGVPKRILPIGEFHYAWSPYINDPYKLFIKHELPNDLVPHLEKVLPKVAEKYPSINDINDIAYDNAACAYALTLIPDVWFFDERLRFCPRDLKLCLYVISTTHCLSKLTIS